jgi:hypothetical protein
MEASSRSPSDQWSSSTSPPHSSKSLFTFSTNTSRYCLQLCPGLLKDSFFGIPLYPKSQSVFAFDDPTWKAEQVTWTVLPQWFRDSNHLFGLALTQDLAEWQYPYLHAILLEYEDDLLLLCELTEPVNSWATESLLNFLADTGYKISKQKAQLC